MFPRNGRRLYRAPLTSSGRAFPRVAGDGRGAGANRQKSGVEGPSRATNHRSVCVSLTWALFHRRWLSARRARRRVAEATVRGRPCNEQHCIRAANPRAHCCHGALLLLLRVGSEKQTCATPSPRWLAMTPTSRRSPL